MACYPYEEEELVTLICYVIGDVADDPPRALRYYGGPLSGWVGDWRVAAHYYSREAAAAIRDAIGRGSVIEVFDPQCGLVPEVHC